MTKHKYTLYKIFFMLILAIVIGEISRLPIRLKNIFRRLIGLPAEPLGELFEDKDYKKNK